jgi:tRNA threonylcarbamoyladenosine biosynthesis protein TsaB
VRVLGLDTATRATTVAVWDTVSGEVVEQRDDPPAGARPRHTTQLLTLAQRALTQAGADWTTIDRIAVGTGPGTFTGIRIGVSTARALAAALGREIVGVSTLRAVVSRAVGAAPDGAQTVAVLDARRGEVFAAAWPRDGARDLAAGPLIAPVAIAPEQLAQALADSGERWLAVGDGAVAFRHVLDGAGVEIPDDDSDLHRVTAGEICRLGLSVAAAVPDAIEPDYLRLPDAELNLRARENEQTRS